MKKLFWSAFTVLCILAMSLLSHADGPTVIKVKYEKCPLTIGTPTVNPSQFYVDTLGFGSDEPNWGYFQQIAEYQGKPVILGYDYHTLYHCLLLGDELVVNDISLCYTKIDSTSNKVSFKRGMKRETIDFNKKNALERVKSLCSTPKNWNRERFVYCLKNEEIPFLSSRSVVEADIPQNPELRKTVLNFIDKIMTPEINDWTDTVYIVEKPVDTLRDIVEKDATRKMLESQGGTPAPPDTLFIPGEGTNIVMGVDYAWESHRYLTMKIIYNLTYWSGGCSGSEEIYYTIDKKTGDYLKEQDLIRPEDKDRIKNAAIEAIYNDPDMMDEDGQPYYPLEIIQEGIMEDFDFNVAIYGDKLILGYPGSNISQFGEDNNWNTVIPLSILK